MHRAPIEHTDYPQTRAGLAEALRSVVEAPEQTKPRLWLTIDQPNIVLDKRPRPLPTFRLRRDGSRPILDDVAAFGCPRPEPCPEPLTGRRAYLLDNLNNRVETVGMTEAALLDGLLKARDLGNQSSVAVDFGLLEFDEPARWEWRNARFTYAQAGEHICGFDKGYGPPTCWPAFSFSRIALVTTDLDYTYLEASPDNLARIADLRNANPEATIRVETLWPRPGSDPFSPGELRLVHTFSETEFCGVFGDPGHLDEHCFEFSDLRSVRVSMRGEGEPWSAGDYAALPLRIAAGVGLAIAMGGAAGAGGGG